MPGELFSPNFLSLLLEKNFSKTFSNEWVYKQQLDINPMVQGFPAKYL